jgi:hypothetical protein
MAIPLSGSISVSTIADEFGGAVPHSLSEYYRGAGLVPNAPQTFLVPSSGAMPMSSFYGTSDRIVIPLNITANTANYDVYTNFVASPAYPSYVAGFSSINVTVDPGVVVSSTSTGTYAMAIPSAFNPGDAVTLVNNGTIVGMGGGGGAGGTASNFGPGSPGVMVELGVMPYTLTDRLPLQIMVLWLRAAVVVAVEPQVGFLLFRLFRLQDHLLVLRAVAVAAVRG